MKEIPPNLKELKRQPANAFGHMPPWCIDGLDEHLQRISF